MTLSDDRILDLGAGNTPDPRADETVDLYADADHQFDLNDTWELPEGYASGLVARHVLEHLDAQHFFEQASRVLQPGGWLEITVPLGENAQTDPDHQHEWTYTTPEVYCKHQQRHWDHTTSFELIDRDLDIWCLPPAHMFTPLLQLLAVKWPNWAAYRCGAGELTATYRRGD